MYATNENNVIIVKATASRYTYVVEKASYSYICPDLDGGYGCGSTPEKAVSWSVRPPLFRTKKAALAAALGEE